MLKTFIGAAFLVSSGFASAAIVPQPVSQPATQPSPLSLPEPATQPTTQAATDPATQPATQIAVAAPATQPTTQPAIVQAVATSKVVAVTVYQSTALVTREVEVAARGRDWLNWRWGRFRRKLSTVRFIPRGLTA